MLWKDFSKTFHDGDHAFLSASNHSWFNYSDEKLAATFASKLASSRGTALHELARRLITLKVTLEPIQKTLNMYVNDSIKMGMTPEYKLYYSKFAYGTADAIDYDRGVLRIFDLKTGITKVTHIQLIIYAAYFFLCYSDINLNNVKDIETRIYQNNEVSIEHHSIDDIVPVMDKIIHFSRLLEELEVNYDDGFDALGSRA